MKTTAIEEFLKALGVATKEQLSKIDSLSAFKMEVTISGRVHAGELKVEIGIGGQYRENWVEGGNYDAVLKEFMRRHGWQEANQPLMLSVLEPIAPAINGLEQERVDSNGREF